MERQPRITLSIGSQRWVDWNVENTMEPDIGEELLENFRQRTRNMTLILRPGDRLSHYADRHGIPHLALPPELYQSHSVLKQRFRDDTWARNDSLVEWIRRYEATAPDLGLVFLGETWIPPRIFRIPKHGFWNFHPGPLPHWGGYLPEFMMLLNDEKEARGTLHRVDDDFDHGAILAYTQELRIPEFAVPHQLMRDICRLGFDTLNDCIDKMRAGPLEPIFPPGQPRENASMQRANREARIHWPTDTHRKIDCRLRVFRSYAFEPNSPVHPLHASIDGTDRDVADIECVRASEIPGPWLRAVPGETLGCYRGNGPFMHAPILRTSEGLAVVLLETIERSGISRSAPIVPGPRPRQTNRADLSRSLRLALS
ncbi:MAG TPA: hypothetical protein DEB39_09105 [Planctomycetaceae bacterium]|nr:hypothetical protein [Planctomycetaceae bacterium]